MLHAVLKGKRYGSGIDSNGHLTADPASGAEDVLSAVFFSRLAYLPDNNVSDFFSFLLPEENVFEGMKEIEFWPKWSVDDSRVEPDVIVLSGESLIIIEAKRYDIVNMQTAEQLAKELVASKTSGFEFTKIILLTVGGMVSCSISATNQLAEEINEKLQSYADRDSVITDDFSLTCLSWKSIYHALKASLTDEDGSVPLHYARLLNDIYQTFIWHGIHVTDFAGLESLPNPHLVNITFPSSFTLAPAAEISRPKSAKIPVLFQNFSVNDKAQISHRDSIPQLFSGTDNG